MTETQVCENPTPGEAHLLAILRKERAARKEAERKFKALWPKYKNARDKAELWEYRAIRYSNKLNAQKIHNAPAGRK